MRRSKSKQSWAIRRHKTPTEFEYLHTDNTWGDRESRRRFDNREEVERRAKAYTSVGVHARIVPYGGKENA